MTEESVFKDKKIFINDKLIGLVGDVITVPSGVSSIFIQGPKKHNVTVGLMQNGDELIVTKTAIVPGNCAYKYNANIPEANVKGKHEGELTIELPSPKFSKRGRKLKCAEGASIGCTDYAAVTVESKPQGAEIWIDGEKVPARTNSDISVPYCSWRDDTTKNFLLRKDGYVNCSKTIDIVTDERPMVRCSFQAAFE